jgi:hypothetical protein
MPGGVVVRAQVIGEVQGGLDAWEAGDRWKVQGITQQVADNPNLKWAY